MQQGSDRSIDILLVEDNPGDARLAAEALREARLDSRLHWAADGAQALSFLLRQGEDADAPRPDLILLDLNLPRKDGRTLLAEIKQHPVLRRIPVVVLTTSRSEEDRNVSYDLQANCFISKPGHWDGFLEVVRSIKEFWLSRATLPTADGPGAPVQTSAPLIPAALIARASAGPEPILPAPAADLQERRILLIEDNPGDAVLVREYLKDAGKDRIRLAHADRLSEGLRRLSEEHFDAVLLDLFLPDSQGLDSVIALSGHPGGPPVVILTGLEDEGLASRALRQGAQDYLIKGQFDGHLLMRALSHAIERTHSGMYLQYLAHHDALTELPNRTLLHDRLRHALEQARRNRHTLAILFLDLDRFKEINDTHGHATGDLLLQSVAARLCGCVRASDTVARVGGDEFVLLLPEISRVEDVTTVCDKIRAAFRSPFLVANRHLQVTASIGASLYPADAEDPETLLKDADTAMYRAKDRGRDNYQLYSSPVPARSTDQAVLLAALRRGLEEDQFLLHYQPTLDAVTGKLLSLEALVRWRHPEAGLLRPRDFLPLAVESGLIVDLGAWVLRRACRQGREWQARGAPPLRIAVNISHRELARGEALLRLVEEVLQETGLDRMRLELEVTEEAIMRDEPAGLKTLRALHALGVRINIDDFGTGYASLSRLRCFPFGSVKIDRTFIRDVTVEPDDAAIVAAITAVGHSLRMNVIAEGVETAEQASFLIRNQIDAMQGPYFGEPAPAVEALQVLQAAAAPARRSA
jgi:diguanylate cyclase (GGDEF)-like protein